jgi:hypothetical protein
MRKNFKTTVLGMSFGLLLAGTAAAITFGQPDGFDGHPHLNVGAVVIEDRALCSGTLIAPRVLVTAAHCALNFPNASPVAVTFDPQASRTGSTFIPGVLIPNPAYDQRQSDPGDIAVVLLDKAPEGITPALLPTLGLLDELVNLKILQGQIFTNVGYGQVREVKTGGPSTLGGFGTRMVSSSSFDALNKAWLRLSQNPATQDGGTCFGDSGGPNFLGGTASNTMVAITITGDAVCRATNVVYRLDTQSARDFLAPYVQLP